jgi:hypothetical protein
MITNQQAPAIHATTINNQDISLSGLIGKKVLIKFHRFSGCPVAQRQIHELMERQNELNASGIETIVFLHSTKEMILPVYKEVPGLHIIPDRHKKFYRLYQSEFSWKKLLSIASWKENFKSFFKGYFPLFNRFQGGITGIPSDFLVDKKGVITDLHYGKHIGDSWTVSEIIARSKKISD